MLTGLVTVGELLITYYGARMFFFPSVCKSDKHTRQWAASRGGMNVDFEALEEWDMVITSIHIASFFKHQYKQRIIDCLPAYSIIVITELCQLWNN